MSRPTRCPESWFGPRKKEGKNLSWLSVGAFFKDPQSHGIGIDVKTNAVHVEDLPTPGK